MDLVISHVYKDFGRGPVLRDVSLTVRQGETVCLMGPSGLGKTTLLRCVAGLERPESGSVTGVPERLGYVFQEDRLLPWRTALQNVALVSDEARAKELLKRLDLGGALALRPRSLSVKLALLAPLMLPSAAVAMLWRTLIPWESLWVLILLLVWKVTGVNAVLFTAAHNKIPGEVIESGQLDGAGGLRLFLRVKWPYLVSSVFFAALIDLVFAWRTFREVYLLTGDYPHDSLYLIQHYLMHMFHRLQYGRLATASIVVVVAVVVITGLMFLLTNAQGKDVEA